MLVHKEGGMRTIYSNNNIKFAHDSAIYTLHCTHSGNSWQFKAIKVEKEKKTKKSLNMQYYVLGADNTIEWIASYGTMETISLLHMYTLWHRCHAILWSGHSNNKIKKKTSRTPYSNQFVCSVFLCRNDQ